MVIYKIRKFDFCLSLIIALGLIYIVISNYQGIGFPKEHQLNYTIGVFSIVKQPQGRNHVQLNHISGKHKTMLFTCSYSPFGNPSTSSCGDTKFLEPYVNKVVTVGWYEQPDFLGFKNDTPQLVTIEVDGQVMRSYASRAEYIEKTKKFDLYIFLPASLLSFPFFYWLFGWLSAVGERRRQVEL